MRQKGFTLIELMIVIAILGILLAVAIPAYQDRQNRQNSGPSSEAVYAEVPATRLMCNDAGGFPVIDEPAIPGERWYFEGGVYVTNDSRGNAVSISPPVGGSCRIE